MKYLKNIPNWTRELLDLPERNLLEQAHILRNEAFASSIEFCAIINIRNGNCAMNCAFCPQSIHHPGDLPPYPLPTQNRLRESVERLADLPVAHIGLVASGNGLAGNEFERLCDFLETLPENLKKRICLSLGKLSQDKLNIICALGIKRYHHNLETSEKYYPAICSTQTWRERYEMTQRVLESGLELCSGALFGMGESWEDRIDLGFSFLKAGVGNIPLNFLNPLKGTPLANRRHLDASECLRIIAIYRHILPSATLRICGGRNLCLGERQKEMFHAGANALMTGNYLTTTGSAIDKDLQLLRELGLALAPSSGNSAR